MQPGDRIGPFVVVRRLGAGQMGVVFEVSRPDLGARYALKVLRQELCSARDLLRFQREVQQLAAVSTHPHVVPIHTAGEDRGSLYYVMDLIQGETLQDKLARAGTLPPAVAAKYVRDVASAVVGLHRAGIVHRDIKPANVMVDERDRARLADFGLARSFTDERGRLTQTGELVGTPHFMAPEQALGTHAGPEADVYALGMVLFTLLAGRPAVDGKGMMQVLTRVGSGELLALPALAPETPDELVEIVGRCFALEPGARATAEQVRAELDAFLAAGASGVPRRSNGVARVLAGMAVTSVVLAAVALALAARRRPQPVATPPSTEVVAPRPSTGQRPQPSTTSAPPKVETDWVALVNTGDPQDVLKILQHLEGGAELSPPRREELLAALRRVQDQWKDPGILLTLDEAQTRATMRLVSVHVVWRRLEPSHRLPAGQRPAAQALALRLLTEGKRPDGTRDIDLRFGSELVQLDPEDVNPYLLYCDIAKNTAQHRDQIDLALIRRGIALARGNPKPWGRLVRALASYLELFAAADASALEELGAVSKDVDASGWSGHDVAMALCHFGNALRHHGRIADAVEAYRRATNLWSDGLTPVGRLAHALFVQARSPDTPAASLDDARRQLDRFFELLHASDEKDENLTIQVTQAACLALETHVGDEASVTLCRRALDAVPKGHMAHVALRHTLLLCRQNAAPAELTRALMDMSQRTDTWVSGIQKTEYPDAVRQGRALAELGRTLAQEVTRGEVTHAEVGRRLRTGFGLTGMETALGQRRSP